MAALALWLSGVFARPSAPPASDPTAKQDSPPPNQVIPPVQSQPDSSGTGGRASPSPAAPPVDKTLNHEPRGAVGPSPPPETRKATRGTSLLIDRIRSWLNRRPAARGTSPLVVNGGTLRFVSIPRGTFMMGCTPGDGECSEDEKARKEVTVPAFQMSATEVTQAFWEATMGENPSDFNGAQQPVENVSWQDATKFVARLNQRGDGFTYRLPQETEWEYAARANGGTPEQLSSVAWFGLLASAGSDARPRDVARKRPNAFGLFDMLGNVAEWCEDWFSPNYQRVVRGGAWTDSATALRFSARGKAVPTTRTYSIGIRVVRTPGWLLIRRLQSCTLQRTFRPRPSVIVRYRIRHPLIRPLRNFLREVCCDEEPSGVDDGGCSPWTDGCAGTGATERQSIQRRQS